MRFLASSTCLLLLIVSPASADFLDTFSYPDGTFPPEYEWTGDPTGGGWFLVQDETFAHAEGGHVHFFRPGSIAGRGEYEFDYLGDDWTFAWRITHGNPGFGYCLLLHPGFVLVEGWWYTPYGYPDGQYMYHNPWDIRTIESPYDPGPGWHHVRIVDDYEHVRIYVDEDLIFEEPVMGLSDGYIGLGSGSNSGVGFPAFDNVGYTWAPPPSGRVWHVPGDAPTIQAGIDSAAAGDTVLVACGTYYEHDIDMKSDIWLRSESGDPDCVTVHAQNMGPVIICRNLPATAWIEGFTFTEGQGGEYGGGVLCERSSPTLMNCLFNVNRASAGGGMYCVDSFPTLINCVFTGNRAPTGAGMCCFDSSPALTGCAFYSNFAEDDGVDYGGGGACCSGGAPVFADCHFLDNAALMSGGGMVCRHSFLTMSDCVFEGNTTCQLLTNGGAGLCCWGGSTTLTRCTFQNNTSRYGGAGAGMVSTGSAFLTDCVFSQNWADGGPGGGMHYHGESLTLVGCSFLNNNANDGGGLVAAGASTTLEQCFFHGNRAGHGGGMHLGASSVTLSNCTLSGNSGTYGAGIKCTGSCPVLENTIIAFGIDGEAICCDPAAPPTLSCCDIYGNEDGDWVGCIEDQYGINGNFSACPQFCDPVNDDYSLQDCSPCAPGNHPEGYDCGLIGAYGVGCDCGMPSRVERTTWSSIKAHFR
ncbi:MAG: right-handed parallel beta-helix repeat-containing protein [Candidatus Eisenbacteria sp.]|nr:right-handed parallel beta-helix repeat-containing protein [Candidatus Eisenbacteria bacterium]